MIERQGGLLAAALKGLRGRCPNCGQGKLFRAYLKPVDCCDACGHNWSEVRADDGADGVLRPGNYSPEKQSDHTAQVFISVPDENNLPAGVTKPEGGWPVALYVHGITSYKETIAAMAGNLAAQGIAVVAIDLPLHGSRSIDMNGDGVYELSTTDAANGAAYANGNTLVFANLSSLRTVRDNLRQSISDMLTLRAALTNTSVYTDSSVQPVAAVDLDGDSVSLIGVSLGSIIGTGVAIGRLFVVLKWVVDRGAMGRRSCTRRCTRRIRACIAQRCAVVRIVRNQ